MGVTRQRTLRTGVRDLLVAGMVLLTAPAWVLSRLLTRWTGRDGFFSACSELLSLVPGAAGVYLRRGFYRMALDSCPPDCHIGFGTTVAHPEVRIGRGVYIGSRCTVGKAVIGDDVVIGSNVDILSGRRQHHFEALDRPILDQGGTFQQI